MIHLPTLVDKYIDRRRTISPHPLNRASEAGHPCVRFLVLARIKTGEQALPSLDLQRVFLEGEFQEKIVKALLAEAGVEIEQSQRPFEWKHFQLSGKIDGFVVDGQERWPLEIKSIKDTGFHQIKKVQSFHELLKAPKFWIRKYPAQLLLYMMMSEKERGMLVFKNKSKAEIHQVDFVLDDDALAYTEEILKKLEEVNDWVARGEAPPEKQCEECQSCSFFRTACFPTVDFGEGFEFLNESELLELLDRRDELAAYVAEYNEIDEKVKEALKGKNAIIGGKWKVESKPYTTTQYAVPEDIKKQFAIKKEFFKLVIERL